MFTDILGWNHLDDDKPGIDKQQESDMLDKLLEFEIVVKQDNKEDN